MAINFEKLVNVDLLSYFLNKLSTAFTEKTNDIYETITGEYVVFTPDINLPEVEVTISTEDTGSKTVYRRGHNMIWQSYENMVPGYSVTNYGITYTINDDMSVTANGTATADSSINLTGSSTTSRIPLPKGSYILSGSPEGAGANTYAMRLRRQDVGGGNTAFLRDTGNGVSFTVTDTKEVARAYIEIKSGVTVDNLVFYPMIRLASESSEYTPWGVLGGSASYTGDETIRTIKGIPGKETIVWSPSGPVTVKYAADVKYRTAAIQDIIDAKKYSPDNPPPYPVESVNGQTGAVSLSIPSTASEVGAIASNQGAGNAGKFMVVGSDGVVVPVTMATWQGGSY